MNQFRFYETYQRLLSSDCFFMAARFFTSILLARRNKWLITSKNLVLRTLIFESSTQKHIKYPEHLLCGFNRSRTHPHKWVEPHSSLAFSVREVHCWSFNRAIDSGVAIIADDTDKIILSYNRDTL